MHTLRTLLRSILLLATFIGLHAAPTGPKKNVLLIMSDDFNHWLPAIGYYPDAKTPNLNKLASRGLLFTRAYSASPVCNPSRNALWSGYRPYTTGIMGNQDGYIREIPGFKNALTLNQYFTTHGYHTLGAGKLYHPGKMGSPDTDPAHWSQLYKGGTGSKGGPFYRYKGATVSWSAGELDLNTEAEDTVMANFVANFISKYPASAASTEKPFFIGCGLFRPHLPWNCDKRFYDMYPLDDIKLPAGYKDNDLADVKIPGNATEIHDQILKDNKWKEGIRAYLANLSYADYNVGLLLDALEKSPHRDNTIVLFMGDHGWHLGEKNRWSKHAVFDQANHTSLIIYDPSSPADGQTCDNVVSLLDLYPTLVELCGLPANPETEGRSLAPLLQNPARADWQHSLLLSYNGTHYIKTNEWTFIEQGENSQLYHAKKDPYEWTNLYGKPGSEIIIAALRAEMKAMMTSSDAVLTRRKKSS